MPTLLVTGGAGFIGSHLVRYWLKVHPDWKVIVYDKLTYAGSLDNIRDLQCDRRLTFVKGDIADRDRLEPVFQESDLIVNLAAETHVDRSLMEPEAFLRTDLIGLCVLLKLLRQHPDKKLIHVSTDEVYGTVECGRADEDAALRPTSPYSASKAGADLLALAYYKSFGVPVIITRCCNNFGPYQYPEKFLPLMITNALLDLPLPIYGDGRQIREWIYVEDHCRALDHIGQRGEIGETYNIATGYERENIEMARRILQILNKPESLLRFVADRPGHDRRYALNWTKLAKLGWSPLFSLDDALQRTVDFYVRNREWWMKIRTSREFQTYYEANYGWRFDDSSSAVV